MPLITENYRDMNIEMHERLKNYGNYGSRWALKIEALANQYSARSILDYGCGKGTLAQALSPRIVAEYDPAIPGKDTTPGRADIVVCTDVMEHIEPPLLEDVLENLRYLTRKVAFLNISTRRAGKSLKDGRNAHLIIEGDEWWRSKLCKFFEPKEWFVDNEKEEINCVLAPKSPLAAYGFVGSLRRLVQIK